MQHFVTGATGFVGKRLVKALLQRRGATVFFLLRRESEDKVQALLKFWGAPQNRVMPVYGDLTAKRLGVASDVAKQLEGKIDHFCHLAAVYDLSADEESQVRVNIEGTRNAVEFAKAIDAAHLHPRPLDRRRRAPRRRVPRGHVRRGRGPRAPLFHDQARERGDRADRVQGAVDGVPACPRTC